MCFRVRNPRPKAGTENPSQQRRDEAKIQMTKALDDINRSGTFGIYKGTNELDHFSTSLALAMSPSHYPQTKLGNYREYFTIPGVDDGTQIEVDFRSRIRHELSYGECRIRNPKWHPYLTSLVGLAASTLGNDKQTAAWICPELSKMLLYGPGAQIQRHKE